MKILLICKETKKCIFNNYIDSIYDKLQQKGYIIELCRFDSFKMLEELFVNLKQYEFDRIIIVGGEITINETIRIIIKYEIYFPINIFPTGSSNNYLNYFYSSNTLDNIIEAIEDESGLKDIEELRLIYNENRYNITSGINKQSQIRRVSKKIKIVSKGAKCSVKDSYVVIKDLPKHRFFSYANKNSINKRYFKIAKKSLDDGYLYIILSSTGSAAGEMIRRFTSEEYSHISLAFDKELKTITSYNNGNGLYSPGLNHEMLDFFYQKQNANLVIYKLKASKIQKARVLREIRRINKQGSSYNILGLLLPYPRKRNIMFCSQFVYSMLETVDLDYFEKKFGVVKPIDFIELDYEKKLEYYKKIFVKDII